MSQPVNFPPVNFSPVNISPVNVPSVNIPPVNVPPVNVPPANIPSVNFPPVNFPPVNVPPVNVQPINVPTWECSACEYSTCECSACKRSTCECSSYKYITCECSTCTFPNFTILTFLALSQAWLPTRQAGTSSGGCSSTTGLTAAAPGCPRRPRAIHWNCWNYCQGDLNLIWYNLNNSCPCIFEYLCLIPDRNHRWKRSKNVFLWQSPPSLPTPLPQYRFSQSLGAEQEHTLVAVPPYRADYNYSRKTIVTKNLQIYWENITECLLLRTQIE